MESIASFYANSEPYSEKISVDECSGFKVAFFENITLGVLKGISGVSYSFKDTFKCKKGHSKITFGCNCGFYSFKNFSDAINLYFFRKGLFIFKTENYGDIFEHETGYISEQQDITEIYIPNRCYKSRCKNDVNFITQKKSRYLPSCYIHKLSLYFNIEELTLISKISIKIIDKQYFLRK